jgi:predicted house-cleaning noncanonical NTP pyrophosphatase (MazG superfamily)
MKKLIRDKMAFNLNPDELDYCHDKEELMELYSLKLREEIEEIKGSDYKDIMEYGDLIQVALGSYYYLLHQDNKKMKNGGGCGCGKPKK